SPSREILGKMLLWHHSGQNPEQTQINNSEACKCLRNNHGVVFVEDGLRLLNRVNDPAHHTSTTCKCIACSHDRRSQGCVNPAACVSAVERKLSRLLPKWDPRQPPQNLPDIPEAGMPPNAFKAPPQATSLRDGFRVFTHEPPSENPTQLTARPQRELTTHGEPLSIFVGSAVGRNNNIRG
ncbi:hypothetical protein B0H13DRAFT_1653371, partial [Mycena leptocephala]